MKLWSPGKQLCYTNCWHKELWVNKTLRRCFTIRKTVYIVLSSGACPKVPQNSQGGGVRITGRGCHASLQFHSHYSLLFEGFSENLSWPPWFSINGAWQQCHWPPQQTSWLVEVSKVHHLWSTSTVSFKFLSREVIYLVNGSHLECCNQNCGALNVKSETAKYLEFWKLKLLHWIKHFFRYIFTFRKKKIQT